MEKSSVVVAGAGQAALSLVAKLRAEGHSGTITVVGAETTMPYQRPPLSKGYLLGKQKLDQLLLRPREFYEQSAVDLRLGQSIVSIHPASKEVALAGGDVIPYDELVLATGSTARQWPAALGGTLRGIHTLRSLDDAHVLQAELSSAKSVLVIGGGYIGLEIASALRSLNLAVTVVEAQPRILNRVAGPETASHFRLLHQENGVRIIENTAIRRLHGSDRVEAAKLADGQLIACDLVVVGIGGAPETKLAEMAGLHVDNGIVTNELGKTSSSSIWAAGDCTSIDMGGRRIRLESVGNAIDQAETVAMNIIGRRTAYVPRPWFWTEQYGVRMQIVGLSMGHDETILRTETDGKRKSCWYFKNSALIAVDAINDPQAFLAGRRIIDAGILLDMSTLREPEVDLRNLGKTADIR
ncbi:NAD(P)/FAD-dependent oxidoreductase [Oryzicola mucosus]|uniref:FAD-dependent oxidoreductase n=1 Tax=Oryzicola mucosus TaxID=2767425 RepID=A0A8J6PYY5_9HYPH|nr:FAD-dependent oxidoreductase [Oryzicola mucosus]MBD0417203.1 FAD-dependent oxidoreductase [Oryzicola mucosus]